MHRTSRARADSGRARRSRLEKRPCQSADERGDPSHSADIAGRGERNLPESGEAPIWEPSRGSFIAMSAAVLAAPSLAGSADLTAIKMAGVPEDSATTVLYGIQSGLFKPYGLDVDMQPQHNGPSVMSGVVGGSYQIGSRARRRSSPRSARGCRSRSSCRPACTIARPDRIAVGDERFADKRSR